MVHLSAQSRGGPHSAGLVPRPIETEDTLAVPLSQLKVTHGEGQTREAVEDRQYWTARGYQL